MAYALITLGIALAYLDYLGTANLKAAGTLLEQELFTGSNPYYKWAGAIIIIALLGYVKDLQPIAVAMLILVFLGIVLSHESGFAGLIKAL